MVGGHSALHDVVATKNSPQKPPYARWLIREITY